MKGGIKKIKKILSKLLPQQNFAIIHYENVQQQLGICDCGLFALAFMIALCENIDPSTLRFDQDKMREHYLECNANNKLKQFPYLDKHSNKQTSKRQNSAQVQNHPIVLQLI